MVFAPAPPSMLWESFALLHSRTRLWAFLPLYAWGTFEVTFYASDQRFI